MTCSNAANGSNALPFTFGYQLGPASAASIKSDADYITE